MDLFDNISKNNEPLSYRMRPNSLDKFVGQKHILAEGKLLSRAIKAHCLNNCIFYGPPGTGKTTLANIIANTCDSYFVKLNAVSDGVKDAKEVISDARKNFRLYGKRTYLLLDECHRWSKSQSDSILEALEDGSVVFIGSTTENPYFSMTRAIVSRCTIFEFKPLTVNEIATGLRNALTDKVNGLGNINVVCEDSVLGCLANLACGDLRNALNALELAVLSSPKNEKGEIVLTNEIMENSIVKKLASIDENTYYDLLSAFCKSLRGSDAEAALYYANLLIESGCDPLIICRRLIAHASEDVGMADSNALLIAISALTAMKELGMPEGNIPLTHAIIYVCEAEKSNSVVTALEMARADAKNFRNINVPSYLKNNDNLESENPKGYKYPHNFGGYVKQVYMPKGLENRVYYVPSKNGREKSLIRKKQ